MTIRILVNGAYGKMGTMACEYIAKDNELSLIGKSGSSDDLAERIATLKPDVVLDLTRASVAYKAAKTIIESGTHAVIGTSGLKKEEITSLSEIINKTSKGSVIVPNFSISAVLMMKFAAEAVKYMPDVEIIEMHHNGKEDSPSGTAIRTSELLHENRGEYNLIKKDHELIANARGADNHNIRIHSVRLQGLLAHQEVVFGGEAQTLTIRSDTFKRESFMSGICLACKKVYGTKTLVNGLEHLLN